MSWSRWLVFAFALLAIVSCKVKVVVPEGGTVTTGSGAYSCEAGKPCDIDIVDVFFDETFTANPAAGYEFHAWKNVSKGLCGGTANPCRLTTEGFDESAVLMEFLTSDEVFFLTPAFVKTSDSLRMFKQGDKINYRGTISFAQPGAAETVAKVTAVREFFETENKVDQFPVMLHQLTLRLVSDGSEYPEASYYYQDGKGAWFDVSDTAGNFIVNRETSKFGVLGYASPLMPSNNEVISFRLVAANSISNTIAAGSLTLRVYDRTRIVVPLGTFRAFRVSSTIELELLAGASAGARIEVVQNQWVVPHIGPIKTESTQRNYNNLGIYTDSYDSELEAVRINF